MHPDQSDARWAAVGAWIASVGAEVLAEAIWDAREARDPSGPLTGVTMTDQTRAPVFWKQAVAEDLWPGSREDQFREAQLVLDLLNGAASDEKGRS